MGAFKVLILRVYMNKVVRAVALPMAFVMLLTGFSACKAHKGRQQPKHGPMPCPIKDC